MNRTAKFHKHVRSEYKAYFGRRITVKWHIMSIDRAIEGGNFKKASRLYNQVWSSAGKVTLVKHKSPSGHCQFQIPLSRKNRDVRILVDVDYPCKVVQARFQVKLVDEPGWFQLQTQDYELVTQWARLFSRYMYCKYCEPRH